MYHLVRVGFKGGKPSAFMFVDDETHKKGIISVERLREFVGRFKPRNIEIENGKLVTNGKLSRYYYGRIKGEVKQPIVILRKFVDKGRTIGFEVFKEPNSAIIKVSPANLLKALSNPSNVLANGRVVRKDGKLFISAIKGNFDTYDYNKIATIADKRRMKKKEVDTEKTGISIVSLYESCREYRNDEMDWRRTAYNLYRTIRNNEVLLDRAKEQGIKWEKAVEWAKKQNGELSPEYLSKYPYSKYEGIRFGPVEKDYNGTSKKEVIYDYKGREYIVVVCYNGGKGDKGKYGLATINGDILIPGMFENGDGTAFKVTHFDRNIIKVSMNIGRGGSNLCGFISLRTGKMTDVAYIDSNMDKDLGTPMWMNAFTEKPEDIREVLSKSAARVSDLRKFIPKYSRGNEKGGH